MIDPKLWVGRLEPLEGLGDDVSWCVDQFLHDDGSFDCEVYGTVAVTRQ